MQIFGKRLPVLAPSGAQPPPPAATAATPASRDAFERLPTASAAPRTAIDSEAVASDRASSPELLRRAAAATQDAALLARIARHPNAPDDVVLALWQSDGALGHPRVAAGGELTARLTALIAHRGSPAAKLAMLERVPVPPEVLTYLASQPQEDRVRHQLTYVKLAQMPVAALRHLARAHPGGPTGREIAKTLASYYIGLTRPPADASPHGPAVLETLGLAELPAGPSAASLIGAGPGVQTAVRRLIEDAVATQALLSARTPRSLAERACLMSPASHLDWLVSLQISFFQSPPTYHASADAFLEARRGEREALGAVRGLDDVLAEVRHAQRALGIAMACDDGGEFTLRAAARLSHLAPLVERAAVALGSSLTRDTTAAPLTTQLAIARNELDALLAEVVAPETAALMQELRAIGEAARHGAVEAGPVEALVSQARGSNMEASLGIALRDILRDAMEATRESLRSRRLDGVRPAALLAAANALGDAALALEATELGAHLDLARELERSCSDMSFGRARAVQGHPAACASAVQWIAAAMEVWDWGPQQNFGSAANHPTIDALPRATQELVLTWLARHPSLMAGAARDPRTPPNELAIMAARPAERELKQALVANPSTPDEVLIRLAVPDHGYFETWVPQLLLNPRLQAPSALSAAVLAQVSRHTKDWRDRLGVIAHPATPPEVFVYMAASHDPKMLGASTALEALATSPRCPDLARRLALPHLQGDARVRVMARLIANQSAGAPPAPEASPFAAVVAQIVGPPAAAPTSPPVRLDAELQLGLRSMADKAIALLATIGLPRAGQLLARGRALLAKQQLGIQEVEQLDADVATLQKYDIQLRDGRAQLSTALDELERRGRPGADALARQARLLMTAAEPELDDVRRTIDQVKGVEVYFRNLANVARDIEALAVDLDGILAVAPEPQRTAVRRLRDGDGTTGGLLALRARAAALSQGAPANDSLEVLRGDLQTLRTARAALARLRGEAAAMQRHGFVCRGRIEIIVRPDAKGGIARWDVRFENTGKVPWAGTMSFGRAAKRAGFGFESMGVPESGSSAIQPIFADQDYGLAPRPGEIVRLGVRGYGFIEVPLPKDGRVSIDLHELGVNTAEEDSKKRYFEMDYVAGRRAEKMAGNKVAFFDGRGKAMNSPTWC